MGPVSHCLYIDMHAAEQMKRMRLLNSDTDVMVDRRIVVKLLTTYFERGQSPEVLQLMTRMLGFTGEPRTVMVLQSFTYCDKLRPACSSRTAYACRLLCQPTPSGRQSPQSIT